jgi:ankyrin repeat protein
MSIFEAIEQGQINAVAEYIRLGGDLNATDEDGDTLLEAAAAYGKVEVVCSLLAAGADPNCDGDYESNSALAMALENGHWEVFKILVAAGANVNIRLDGGMTPLMCVANSPVEMYDVLEVLLEAGADPDANCDGDIALVFALRRGNMKSCRRLAPLASASDLEYFMNWVRERGEEYLPAHQRAEALEILERVEDS